MQKQILKFLFLLVTFFVLPNFVIAAVSISVTPTSSSVLPGSVRSVYSNIQGDANLNVIWSTSGGGLISNVGYAAWTAPQIPGTYTVTSTSVADATQSAVTTFTVISDAVVKMSNIPMQATVFKNQPLIIQSIIWGSVDTSVTWSSSGGILRGEGREVVFRANEPGSYTVSATSNADNSKISTTTIVVTNNEWLGIATPNKTQPVDCISTGNGETYEITSEENFDDVPWSTLGAGDTVRIHPGIYHKQILISTSGGESQPIRICGVPDGLGNLPELNGANATAKSDSDFGILQSYGGIMIYEHSASYYGGEVYPKNIIIEGLKITGFNNVNTFTDLSSGQATAYIGSVASVRVQHGKNITIRGNEISFNGNGLFAMSNNSVESQASRNLLIEGNYIHDNGKIDSYLQHQSYLQAFGLVVQGNYYDYPLSGMLGGQLKTRSVQQFIRYNYFKSASRIMDLVEVEDSPRLVFPWLGVESGELINTSLNDVVANYEAYQYRFAYGNVINNTTSPFAGWIFHGAGDNTQATNPGGTFYIYNNTIWSNINASSWRSGLVDLGPYGDPATVNAVWPTANLANNAIWLEGLSPKLFFWNRYMADRVILDKNWITQGWGTGNSAGGDGTGIASSTVAASRVWQAGQLASQVNGISNLATGSIMPFDASSYAPYAISPLVDGADSLSGLALQLPPLMQYSPVSYLMSDRTNIMDIGALAYDASDTTSPAAPSGLSVI
jgi:hypothetical protein